MISTHGEFGFIDWVRRRSPLHPAVALGIGDDAAVLRAAGPAGSLVTVDMLMEGVDFTFPPATAESAGRKALAVNLSDIAAMAGRPTAAFVSVALPRHRGEEFARGLHAGLSRLAGEFDTAIAGGDTNSWDGPLVVSVTLIGEPTGAGPVLRSGARPGDWILVTGRFGGSIHGRHLTFTPRVREAQTLHRAATLHALIDVSDGLAADLRHMLDESGVGAVIDAAAVPVHPDVRDDGRPLLEHALGDGEDFELIVCVPPEEGARLLEAPPIDAPLTKIGEIVAGRDALLRHADGTTAPLPRLGWTHPLGEPASDVPNQVAVSDATR